MFNIKTLNKISDVGLSKFDTAKYSYGNEVENPDAIMVRSASMHDMDFPESLLAIARAGAGVNLPEPAAEPPVEPPLAAVPEPLIGPVA